MGMWDRFDTKTVMYFTGNLSTRVPGMEAELNRVGLCDAIRQWNFPSPIDRLIMKNVPHTNGVSKIGYFNCSLGHYRAISNAYHLGARNAIFMEDDIRFLNDLCKLESAIRLLPSDYDLAMLDWFCIKKRDGSGVRKAKTWRSERRVNEFWSEFDKFFSAGCYALSRNGMERIMNAFECSVTNKSIGMFRIIDHFMDRNIIGKESRMYFAGYNLAIQREMGSSNSSGYDISRKYVELGIELKNYADV